MQQFRDIFKWGRHRMASVTSASYFQYFFCSPCGNPIHKGLSHDSAKFEVWKARLQAEQCWLRRLSWRAGLSSQTEVLVSLSVATTKHADKSSYERERASIARSPSPSLRGHQGRNVRQLLTFTVKSREAHTHASHVQLFSSPPISPGLLTQGIVPPRMDYVFLFQPV